MVKNRLLRFVLIVVGFISLALGVVGIISELELSL